MGFLSLPFAYHPYYLHQLLLIFVDPISRPNTSFQKLSTNIKFKTKRYYFVIQVEAHAHFWFSAVNKLCLEYIWIFIIYI